MQVWIHKLISTFFTFFVTGLTCFSGYIIPFHTQINHGKDNIWLDILKSFSGGVFLGVLMLDILPEIQELEKEQGHRWLYYPIGYLCVCLGFFFMICCNQVISYITEKKLLKDDPPKDPTMFHTSEEFEVVNRSYGPEANAYGSFSSDGSNSPDKSNESQTILAKNSSSSHRKLAAFLFAFAIHNTFEGIIIGFQTTVTDIWILTGTILSHKCLVAFSLGTEIFLLVDKRCAAFVSILIFSIATPIGQIIGFFLSEVATSENSTLNLVIFLLQSIAGGTFMYIVFFEILTQKFIHENNRPYSKCISSFFGFLIIAALTVIECFV